MAIVVTPRMKQEICEHDVLCTTSADCNKDGKWFGWLTRGQEHGFNPILSSPEGFKNKTEAVTAMERFIQWLKAPVGNCPLRGIDVEL